MSGTLIDLPSWLDGTHKVGELGEMVISGAPSPYDWLNGTQLYEFAGQSGGSLKWSPVSPLTDQDPGNSFFEVYSNGSFHQGVMRAGTISGGNGTMNVYFGSFSDLGDAVRGCVFAYTSTDVSGGLFSSGDWSGFSMEWLGTEFDPSGPPPCLFAGFFSTIIMRSVMWPLLSATASQKIPLGPFISTTDGSPQTGLTIANTEIKLEKLNSGSQVSKNSGGATALANGDYYCTLDATDTDTDGPMRITVYKSGCLPVVIDCQVGSSGGGGGDVNVVTIGGQTVTAAAGITFPSSIASPTNITAGTITTVTNLTNAPSAGDFTATMKTSLNAATPAATVSGTVAANVTQVNGSTDGVAAFSEAIQAIGTITVDTGATNTIIPTSAISPTLTVNDQVKGQILCFAKDTITTALRNHKTEITGSTTGGLLTVNAMPAAAVSGDTATIQ